ncbi:MAG TPA: anti-repressor SinI family protein [Bacillota bacterium]|nr:anti-repressor SinI family protein [Bacillota bacterium]
MGVVIDGQHLDVEWVRLIKEARDLGLTAEEIRLFLKNNPEYPVCKQKCTHDF